MNYFEYNGIRSSDMGLHIQRKNVYSSPKYDSSFVSIPGRNGDLIVPNRRYENTQVSYSVYLSAKNSQQLADSITKIKAWLYAQPDRYHILKDSYDKRFFRYALFNSSLDIEDELNKIGVFTVSFNCKPFRYDIDGELPHSIDVVLNFPYMIFCRMDGSKPENDWSNRWNQTADLVVPSGKNMFVLNTNSWTDGYWDYYSDADKSRIYLKVNENWKKENARFALYTFISDETAWYSLEKVSEDIYRVTLPSKGETVLVNPYSFESRPLIHLNGNGTGTLTIDNENGRHEWTFNDIDEFIEIDSEKMCFYKDNTLKNDTVSFACKGRKQVYSRRWHNRRFSISKVVFVMMPILYKADETEFDTYGIGVLSDCTFCEVTEERNGAFECVMKYPLHGALFDEIKNDRVILVKPNDTSRSQPFRIYRITTPMNGIITVYAQHMSYDLSGIGVLCFESKSVSPQLALERIFSSTSSQHSFNGKTDLSAPRAFSVDRPMSVRAVLGGTEGSVLDVWGGEYEWDMFDVILHSKRGKDNGVVIEYGKNLTDVEQDNDFSSVYTHLLPYAVVKNGDTENVVTLSEAVLPVVEKYAREKTLIKDFSPFFKDGETVTEDTLRAKAKSYIKQNPFGDETPTVKVSFEPLWQQPEYSQFLEKVNLCDTVTVRHADMNIEVKTKVIETVYDALAEKYS